MSDPGGSEEPTISDEGIKQLGLPLWDKGIKKLNDDQFLSESDIQLILQHLFSNDYEIRQKSIAYLNINQHVITRPLVDLLVKNSTNHTLIFQLTYALEVIGKFAVPVLLEALNQIREIKTPMDETMLENICETLIRINDKSTVAVPVLLRYLKDVKMKIEQINKTIEQNVSHTASSGSARQGRVGSDTPESPQETEGLGKQKKTPSDQIENSVTPTREAHQGPDTTSLKKLDFYQMVRMKIHYLLGEMNSTEGLDDLLELLGDGNKRVYGEIIETLGKIGNKNALIPLIRLYPIEAEVSELGARYIKLTCREIIRREKISKSDHIFDNLTDSEKDTSDKILAGYKNGNKN